MKDVDWYEAEIIDNSLLGNAFPLSDTCVFRFRNREKSRKKFEIFNLKNTVVVLTGDEAKTQLRSKRDKYNLLVRAKDQGYVNWKLDSNRNLHT